MALSSVAIVFLVLGILFAVYFVVGSLVRYQGGLHRCPEVLPNYRLWCGVFGLCIRVFTCGRYRVCFLRDSGVEGLSVLPNRPHTATDVAFTTFQSGDDEWDDPRGLQPAEVVVRL